MQIARINKVVRKVVLLQTDGNGNSEPVVLYKKDSGQKKMSKPLRPLEKAVRRLATAQSVATETYLGKHGRSNGKNKDGWLRDIVPNVVKATGKGQKKLRIARSIMK